MEELNEIIHLLSEKVKEILRKETALTPDDVNAVKELSVIILGIEYKLKI